MAAVLLCMPFSRPRIPYVIIIIPSSFSGLHSSKGISVSSLANISFSQALVRGVNSLFTYVLPTLVHSARATFGSRSELGFANTNRAHETSRSKPVVVTIELTTIQVPDFAGQTTTGQSIPAEGKVGRDLRVERQESSERFEGFENALARKASEEDHDVELGLHIRESHDDEKPRPVPEAMPRTTISAERLPEGAALRPLRRGESVRDMFERRSWEANVGRRDATRRKQEDAFGKQI